MDVLGTSCFGFEVVFAGILDICLVIGKFSVEVVFWALFWHSTLLPILIVTKKITEMDTRIQENIEKVVMLNKHWSLEKLPLSRVSANYFLVSRFFLLSIFGFKLIQSDITLWVLQTYLIIGLHHLIVIFMTAWKNGTRLEKDTR